MRKPELLAPAGSFLAACSALEAGADGIYLGLKDFSARAAARNFSLDQLRRIRRLAADRGRRVYVTLNTVIREAEVESLSRTLGWLEALEVDAVILQDLGVCELVARSFPRLVMYASTQMALHDERGLRAARDLGIKRVILPRELTLERIRRLRQRVPEVELEVFVHGALCYSFSGICLASWALTGRSGNRGDCAQICRSAFTEAETGAKGPGGACDGHLFSCRDLFLGREVLALADAGVDSLKIEGRMKSPEYVFNVTRLYRAILDQGADLPDPEYAELSRRVELSFSRQKTTGWLHHPSATSLIDVSFPGHRGPVIGTVQAVQGREIQLSVSADISVHDGLGFFTRGAEAPVAFPVTSLRKGGRAAAAEVRFARAGDTVLVTLPAGAAPPPIGTEIMHMSSRFLDLPEPREAGFPLYKMPRSVRVLVSADGGLELHAPGSAPFRARLTLSPATRPRPFARILEELLRESGDSLFTPSEVLLENRSGLPDDGIFVPPSQLKKAKNDFYSHLDAAFVESVGRGAVRGGHLPVLAEQTSVPHRLSAADLALVTDRQRISPPACAPVPFADQDPGVLDVASLAELCGYLWLPLPPVIMEGSGWNARLRTAAAEAGDRGSLLAVGLNNLSQVALAGELAGEAGIAFFIDIYLYVANSLTLALLRRKVPRLLFAYAWIEGSAEDARTCARSAELADAAAGVAVLPVADGFHAPLFYSLGCFARHVLNNGQMRAPGKCFEDCPKDFTRELRQGKGRFQAVVRDCVTWLFKL